MQIEAPDDCVAVWLRADIIYVRFPDRQLVEFPATEIARLRAILQARERGALKIGSDGAPDQWTIDQTDYDRALSARITRDVQGRLKKEQDRELKLQKRAKAKADAEKLLEELGL